MVRTAVLAGLALTLGGCGVSGLNFVEDDRVEIVAPAPRSEVSLPLTVTWEARDFDGTFGVLVDRAPQPPGEPLDWYARDDGRCLDDPDCPDEAWLAERGIRTTTGTSLEIEALPPRRTDGRRDLHTVTIVLLDEQGRRVGESAFAVDFELVRGRG